MSVLVGRQIPDFTAAAVLPNGDIENNFNLYSALKGKYGLVFFYPLDFTFVCPTELVALNNKIEAFKELDINVIAVSIDSQFTHQAWRKTPRNEGGIGELKYTLVADVNHRICQSFGVEHPEAGVAFRGAFLIDKQQIVRSQIVNDLPIGRSIEEILRVFQALQHHEQHGEVCPANWDKGKDAMTANAQGVSKYLEANAKNL